MNPIRSRADMPANQPYDKTPCQSAYGTDPALAPYCYGLCKPRIPRQQSLNIGASFFRLVARITTIRTPPEESRPASTRLQRQYASTTPARVYNAGVESKVGGSFYRGKGRGKTREA